MGQFMDWLLPALAALIMGRHRAEVGKAFALISAYARRAADRVGILISHNLLIAVRDLHAKFAIYEFALTVPAVLLALLAPAMCGTLDVPWWVHLLPMIALVWILLGRREVAKDAEVQPIPTHLQDMREGYQLPFARFSDQQKQFELEAAGSRFRTDLETRGDTALTPEGQDKEIALRAQLMARFHAQGAFAPLMEEAEHARQLEALGFTRAQNTSPITHMLALVTEPLAVSFTFFVSAVLIGTYSFPFHTHGFYPAVASLIGVLAVLAFALACVGWYIVLRTPLEVASATTTAIAQPTTGLLHLLIRSLPEVDQTNVRAMFGDFTGQVLAEAKTAVAEWERGPMAAYFMWLLSGLIIPHVFTAFATMMIGLVTGVLIFNLTSVKVDVKARRQASAEKAYVIGTMAVVIYLVFLFVALFARTWFAGFVASVFHALNALLSFGANVHNLPFKDMGGWDQLAFVLKIIFFACLVYFAGSWASAKTASKWERRIGIFFVIVCAVLLVNTVGRMPLFPAAAIGRHLSLACPGEALPAALIDAPVEPPVVAVKPQPVQPPPPSAVLPPVYVPLPAQPVVRRGRRSSGETRVWANVERGCTPLPGSPLCSSLHPDDREDMRIACGCR